MFCSGADAECLIDFNKSPLVIPHGNIISYDEFSIGHGLGMLDHRGIIKENSCIFALHRMNIYIRTVAREIPLPSLARVR